MSGYPVEWTGDGEWVWTEHGTTHHFAVTWNLPDDIPRHDLFSRLLRFLRIADRKRPAVHFAMTDDEAYEVWLDGTTFPPPEETP